MLRFKRGRGRCCERPSVTMIISLYGASWPLCIIHSPIIHALLCLLTSATNVGVGRTKRWASETGLRQALRQRQRRPWAHAAHQLPASLTYTGGRFRPSLFNKTPAPSNRPVGRRSRAPMQHAKHIQILAIALKGLKKALHELKITTCT